VVCSGVEGSFEVERRLESGELNNVMPSDGPGELAHINVDQAAAESSERLGLLGAGPFLDQPEVEKLGRGWNKGWQSL